MKVSRIRSRDARLSLAERLESTNGLFPGGGDGENGSSQRREFTDQNTLGSWRSAARRACRSSWVSRTVVIDAAYFIRVNEL